MPAASNRRCQANILLLLRRRCRCLVDLLHGLHLLLCKLALALVCCLGGALALQQGTTVLVQLQLGDDALAGVNANVDGGT